MAKDYAKTKTSKSKPRSSSSAGQESSEGRLWLLALVLFVLFAAGLVFLKHESKKIASDAPPTKSTIAQTNQSPQETTPQPKFDFYSVLPGQPTGTSSQNNSSSSSGNNSSDQSQNSQGNNNSTATSDATNPKSQIPAPSSDFSQSSLQQQPNSQASPAGSSVNSQSTSQQDQTSQTSTSDTSSAAPSDSTASDTNSDNSSTSTTPQQQVSDLVKQQLDEESDSSSSNSCHGIINPSTTNYILQLGLFNDSTAADQQRAQLVIQGLEVKIKSIKKNGNTYYRIWMGPYKTKQEALKQQQQLQSSSVKSELIKQSN